MSKAKLLFDLMMYVNSRASFTAQDVAHEFGISVRTAHRYLTEIEEMGVPLYTEQGRGGGYRILKNRMLPPILFDENEAMAIFFAFQIWRHYSSLPFDADIASASRKLLHSLPGDLKEKIERLHNVLSFWNPTRSAAAPFLQDILEAAMERRVLRIEYSSKSANKYRELMPLGAYAYDGFWYMPAIEAETGEARLFRADRLVSLEQTDKMLESSMTLHDFFSSYTVKEPIRLVASLTKEGVRQSSGQPWLEPWIVQNDETGDGNVDMVIDRSELNYVAQFFARLGTDAKVSEPQEIVARIRRHAERLLDHYRKIE